jgi:hypothetical protein
VSAARIWKTLHLPGGKGHAGREILPDRPRRLCPPATATVEQIARAICQLTIPLDAKPLYDCRASAAVSQVKVNNLRVLPHVSRRETEDRKCGRLYLLLICGDKLLHRTSVVDGDDERDDRDKNR